MDKLLHFANVVYLAALVVVVVSTFAIYELSKRVTDAKDRELKQFRTESEVSIATAKAESANAIQIAETEKRARAELESQVAAAGARAAEANLAASEAQLELAKLKAPRTVAPEDQARMIADLKAFTGQKYSVAVFQDPEALALLRVLNAMLKSAGWLQVDPPYPTILISVDGIKAAPSFHSGVIATIGRDGGASAVALRALSDGLSRAGIPCRRGERSSELQDKSPNTIVIDIGKKPLPRGPGRGLGGSTAPAADPDADR